MPATKISFSFKAYDNGVMINSTDATTFVNDLTEVRGKMKTYVEKFYESARDMTISVDQKLPGIGLWIVFGTSNTDPNKAFLITISKLS